MPNNVEVQFMEVEIVIVTVLILSNHTQNYCRTELILKMSSSLLRFHLQSPRSQMFCFFPRRSTPPLMAAQIGRRRRLTAPWTFGLLSERSHQMIFPVLLLFQICQSKMRITWEQTRRVQKSRHFSHLCRTPPSQSWKGRWPTLRLGQVCLWKRLKIRNQV